MIKRMLRCLIPKSVLKERTRRQAQQNWSEQHRIEAGSTSVTFCIPAGLGDQMIATQFLEEFARLAQSRPLGLPRRVVIVAGVWSPDFIAPRGDLNLYWWWSMGGRRDWLPYYLANVRTRPDAVLCLSQQCVEEVEALGLEALHLPLGVGRRFQPPEDGNRTGVCYAGSKGHKDPAQEAIVIGPFAHRTDFQWVDHLRSPSDLSVFYGTCSLVLGMTDRLQEEMGMVNNRVFEVLATDTPFLIHRHHNLESVLGFEYPWQTGSIEETVHLARLLGEIDASEFARIGRVVREQHSWKSRLDCLSNHFGKSHDS